ncbi:MAG: hypothetical protein R3248_01025 [Candidatus Promineifilaceae bacterium]|nr:hypothetical protein [Candidatus Promineifilaceae bacterium]
MSRDLYDIELMARERHRDLLREAEQHRLVKQALAGRPKKQNAIVAWLRQAFRRPAPQAQVPSVQASC